MLLPGVLGSGLFEGGLEGRLGCGKGSVRKIEAEAPAEDHAEGEDEEEAAGLLEAEYGVEVAAGEVADGGEDDDDGEEGCRSASS